MIYTVNHTQNLCWEVMGNQLGDYSPCFVTQRCFVYQVFITFVFTSVGCRCSYPQSWKETALLHGWWLLKICKWADCLRRLNGCCWCPVLSCEWRKESDIVSPAPRVSRHCRRADGKNTRDSKRVQCCKAIASKLKHPSRRGSRVRKSMRLREVLRLDS